MGTKPDAGQQAVNAALAALAKTGDAFALGQLWQINRGLLRSLFWRWYPAHKALADAHGMTADDFEQDALLFMAANKKWTEETIHLSALVRRLVQKISQNNQAAEQASKVVNHFVGVGEMDL